jgi:hypothetical protein
MFYLCSIYVQIVFNTFLRSYMCQVFKITRHNFTRPTPIPFTQIRRYLGIPIQSTTSKGISVLKTCRSHDLHGFSHRQQTFVYPGIGPQSSHFPG